MAKSVIKENTTLQRKLCATVAAVWNKLLYATTAAAAPSGTITTESITLSHVINSLLIKSEKFIYFFKILLFVNIWISG